MGRARPMVQASEQVFGRRIGVAIGERYDTILNAARTAFARRGFHQASIREIAHAARLSLAGLYHYVGGKHELLFLVLDRALDTLTGAADTALGAVRTPEARLLALIRTHLEFGFRLVLQAGMVAALRQTLGVTVNVPAAPQFVTALGAALLGLQRFRKLSAAAAA